MPSTRREREDTVGGWREAPRVPIREIGWQSDMELVNPFMRVVVAAAIVLASAGLAMMVIDLVLH